MRSLHENRDDAGQDHPYVSQWCPMTVDSTQPSWIGRVFAPRSAPACRSRYSG